MATKMITGVVERVLVRDLDEKEAQELANHKKFSALSWSHAIHDRDHYKALLGMPT